MNLQKLKTLFFTPQSGPTPFQNWFSSVSSGEAYDAKTRAGKLHENASVAACVKAMLRMLTDADICAQKRKPKSQGAQWELDWEHSLTELLQNPNPYFDATQLLDYIALWYVFDGNSYLWKQRALSKMIIGLWPLPVDKIWPVRSPDGGQYLDGYHYTVNGETYFIPPEDIIHIKNGIDPDNELKGWSDVKAQIRNVCTENESSNFINAILHNAGVPNVVISPDPAVANSKIADPKDFGEKWMEKLTGHRRGEPFVQSVPLRVQQFGFDPKSLDLTVLIKLSQAGIAAAIGIPAVVVGLLVGLETATAKASHEESLWQAYVACIVPMLKRIARQLSKGLVNDRYAPMGDAAKLRVTFDLSEVKCLGEDNDKLAVRMALLYTSGIIKRGQAQSALNFDVDEAADDYNSAPAAPQAGEVPAEPTAKVAAAKGQNKL